MHNRFNSSGHQRPPPKTHKTQQCPEAKKLCAKGYEWAHKIKAQADEERTVILAEAGWQSKVTPGERDAEVNRMLSEAFAMDPKFFAFYRAMQT